MSATAARSFDKSFDAELAWSTRGLVLLSVVICEWALLGDVAPEAADYVRWSIWALIGLGLAAGLSYFARARADDSGVPTSFWLATLLVGGWPIACRALEVSETPGAEVTAWEVAQAHSLCGLSVACAALASLPRAAGVAACGSLFLVVFAQAFGDMTIPILRVLTALYAAMGSSWLMTSYWRRAGVVAAAESRRLPWKRRFGIAAALAILVIASGGKSLGLQPRSFGAWFASSGGSQRADRTARFGKQDGANTFRSDQIPESIGFSESEKFLDSPRPSLYDVYNEALGEPLPMQNLGRVKYLEAKDFAKSRSGPPPAAFEAEKKAFSTVRKSPPAHICYGDRTADALCLVEGQSPLHLRLRTYDRFDGRTWHEADVKSPFGICRPTGSDTWMRRCLATEPDGIDTRVVVRVVHLTTNRIPTPADPIEFRTGRIDQADYFAWVDDGVLAMRYQKKLPPGAQFEIVSRQPGEEAWAAAKFTECNEPSPVMDDRNHREAEAKISALIDAWVGDAPRGPAQIAAVAGGLQKHAVLDEQAVVPEAVTDSTAYFLLLEKRGPSYLFASAAACVLDRLGYRVRLASGFYAGEASYDSSCDSYALTAADVHFWAEAQDDSGRWHVVEAAPGRSVYRPRPTWLQHTAALCKSLVGFAGRHHVLTIVASLVVLSFIVNRRRWADQILVWYWQTTARRNVAASVAGCLRIISRRAAAANFPRRPWETSHTFVRRIVAAYPGAGTSELKKLADWADAVQYARDEFVVDDVDQCVRTCGTILQDWPLSRFCRSTTRLSLLLRLTERLARCRPHLIRQKAA